MRRAIVLPLLVSFALAAPSMAAPPVAVAPQVTDPANDANGGANTPAAADKPTPAGSQGYADVLSVLWQTTKATKTVKKKKVTTVTGFTVTATLSAPPTAPTGTSIVYRMLGATGACGFFGVAYYTSKGSDPAQPQSAIRDNCNATPTRLTPLALPVITGNTITWTVPLKSIPADTKVKVGTKITGLWFEVREIEDFHGACVPDDGGATGYGKACGLGAGALDNSVAGSATYTLA
jgi:hypothetical protein